jgi:hypothetical protein
MMKHLIFVLSVVSLLSCSQTENSKKGTAETSSTVKNFKRVMPPALMTDRTERANYLVTHFWEHFNFRDTMYIHSRDITEQAFVDFISLFQYASPDKIKEGVTRLMTSAEDDSVMFAFFSREAERYLYDPISPFRNDEYYIPFLEHIVNTSVIDDTHKIRPRYVLDLTRKNRPGNMAENLQYTTANGRRGTLHDIKADYLLLAFYIPGCSECQNTMEMIRNSAEITPLIRKGTVKAIAIYPDENLDKWKEYLAEVPSNWINGWSLSIREKEIYDLQAIPTLFLLDRDKKVILKDCSVEDMNEYFKKITNKP